MGARRYVRLTHLENRGFFLGLGQKHEKLLRWLPLGVWLAAAACLLPELGKRASRHSWAFCRCCWAASATKGPAAAGQRDGLLQFPHRKAKKRALVWNLADFMLIGGVVLTMAGLVKELIKK